MLLLLLLLLWLLFVVAANVAAPATDDVANVVDDACVAVADVACAVVVSCVGDGDVTDVVDDVANVVVATTSIIKGLMLPLKLIDLLAEMLPLRIKRTHTHRHITH